MKRFNVGTYLKLKIGNCIINKRSYLRWNVLFPICLRFWGIVAKKKISSLYDYTEKLRVININYNSTNTISFIAGSFFYKFPLDNFSTRKIKQEEIMWNSFCRNTKIKQLCLPSMETIKIESGSIIAKYTRAFPITIEEEKIAYTSILKQLFCSCIRYDDSVTTISMEKGIRLLTSTFGKKAKDLTDVVSFRWKKKKVKLGPIHGDFHVGNMMKYHNNYCMVDMDRCSMEGPQLFDVIHIAVSKMYVKHRTWIECLFYVDKSILDSLNLYEYIKQAVDDFDLTCLLAYMLDRLGRDHLYADSITNITWLDDINRLFLNKFFRMDDYLMAE